MSQADAKPLPFVYQFMAGKSQSWRNSGAPTAAALDILAVVQNKQCAARHIGPTSLLSKL
jgi:hypothetical protein